MLLAIFTVGASFHPFDFARAPHIGFPTNICSSCDTHQQDLDLLPTLLPNKLALKLPSISFLASPVKILINNTRTCAQYQ
jgi:hypothetical protein